MLSCVGIFGNGVADHAALYSGSEVEIPFTVSDIDGIYHNEVANPMCSVRFLRHVFERDQLLIPRLIG